MKLKKLFSVIGLGLFAVASVSAGVLAFTKGPRMEMVKADPTPTVYYLTGDETSWSADKNDLFFAIADGAAPQQHTFTAGKQYKFVLGDGTWTGAIGYQQATGTAFGDCFEGSDNFKCVVGGDYYVNIRDGVLHINLEETTTYGRIYVQIQDWTDTYVYAFDTSVVDRKVESLRQWPGTRVSDITDGINFQGSLGGIGTILVPYTGNKANTKLILHNNSGDQSSEAYLNLNHYYYKTGTPRENMGLQAAVVFDINKASVKATSVCDIDQGDAVDLLAEYDALSEANQTAVNGTTYWSYKDAGRDPAQKMNFTFDQVIAQLRVIAAGGSGANVLFGVTVKQNTTLIIVLISSFAGLSLVGTFFVLRRRKHQ